MVIFKLLWGVIIGSLLFPSVACLAALQRHGECLALVNKRLEEETDNPDLFIMRARLHELFRNVSSFKCLNETCTGKRCNLKAVLKLFSIWWS